MTTAAIAVACEHCGHHFRVKSEAAGRSVKCPQCRERTPVTAPTVAAATASGGDGDGTSDPMAWMGAASGGGDSGLRFQDDLPSSAPPVPPAAPVSAYTPPQIDTSQPRQRHVATDHHDKPRQYPALQLIKTACYVLAAIAAGAWLLFCIGIWAMTFMADESALGPSPYVEAVMGTLMATFAAAMVIIGLVAYAETIRVMLDIQDDTRRTALYSSRLPS